MQDKIPSGGPTPFFLASPMGRLFAVYHAPKEGSGVCGNVLIVPPFNEEMNRCRSMVTLLAQEYARIGVGTLVLDLFGTGESDGAYGDARWAIWLDNIRQAIAWLQGKPGGCLALQGIRLGVPLALEAAASSPDVPAVIAWQPVVDGKMYFTQFLRIRLAANMDRLDVPKETTGDMRSQLAAGQSVEVAGYEVHPELAAAIEGINLKGFQPAPTMEVFWFEKSAGEALVLPENSSALINNWRQTAGKVEGLAFEGPAFWALHDRFLAPDLLKKTVTLVDSFRRPE